MSATATAPRDAPATADPTGRRRILALDGLRGVAVAVVVLYHAGHLKGGFLGVDLFFVLSGFLITGLILKSWGREHALDHRAFWARRVRRLLPALLAMLVIVVPIYAIWFATPLELTAVRSDGRSTLLYLTNWQQIFTGQSYWANSLADSPLKHTWTLAVEGQFYLIWPLVAVAVLARKGVLGLRNVALGLAAVGAVLTIGFAVTEVVSLNAIYLGSPTRFAPLLAGAALAAAQRHQPKAFARAQPQLEVAAVGAAVILAWMCVTIGVSDPQLYRWGLLVSAICATILVAAASGRRPGPAIAILEAAPLRFLGMISYGTYLWSWPLMQMINERHTDLRGYSLLGVQLVATGIAAVASWYLLEKPILGGSIKPPHSRQVAVIALAFVAMTVGVATASAAPTVPRSTDSSDYALAAENDATKVMVVGDSVPDSIVADGVVPLRDDLEVSVVNRTVPGCILLREIGEVKGTEDNIRNDVDPCNVSWRDDVAQFDPDVVLMMFGQFARDEVNIDGTFLTPCTPEYLAAEEAALDRGIDDLTSNGARLVIATAPWSSVSWVLDGSPRLAEKMTCLNDLYASMAAERADVDIIDLASYVCPSADTCRDSIDGENLREDTIHYRGGGAEVIARWLIPQVLGAAPAPEDPNRAYCDRIGAIVSGLAASGSTGEEPSLLGTLESLRQTDPASFLEGVPDELRPAIETVTADWNDYLDRAASLSPVATPEEVTATFGPYAQPTNEILQWITQNC